MKYSEGDQTLMIGTAQDMFCRNMKITTCFVIWRERCAIVFRDESKDQLTIIREIIQERKSWFRD
jgi:hypothetical protein